MTLVDLAQRASFGAGFATFPVARLPTGERIDIKATGQVIAYYSEGSMSLEAVEALRAFLVMMAQSLLEQDPGRLQPSPRPGAPPWVLIDHEALELS
jgi:hypothetical protein